MSRYFLHMWVNVILWHGISHYIKDDNVMISEDNQNAVSETGNFTASAIWIFRSVTFMMKSDIILFKNDSNLISIYLNEMLGSRGLKILQPQNLQRSVLRLLFVVVLTNRVVKMGEVLMRTKLLIDSTLYTASYFNTEILARDQSEPLRSEM